MPIRSIADLRGAVGKDWNDVSDEDLIKSYAESVKLDPVSVARELGYDMGEGGVSAKRLAASVSNYVGGLQGVGEAVSGALGFTGVESYLAEKRRANELQAQVASARAKDMGAVESYKDVTGIGSGLNYAAGLGIQSAPYALEAITGGLEARALMGGTRAALSEARTAYQAANAAGNAAEAARATQAIKQAERSLNIGSEIGVAAQSFPSAVGDILNNQREQTGGKTDLGSASLLGVPYAALNVLGVESALGRGSLFRNTINMLDRPGGITGGLARAGATAVGTGIKEGLSETGQEMLNQAGRMAVDDKAQFFSQDAQDRYMESFVGGAVLGGAMGGALGGWRRSEGYKPDSDIQQAFTQPQTSGTPITGQTPPASQPGTTVTAPPVPPNAPTSTVVAPNPDQTNAPITPPSAPAVAGGTTAVAQATQQQTQADIVAQQQQQQQAQREKIIDQFGLQGEKEGVGQFFNRPIFGPAINQVADALAPIAAKLNQQEAAVMDAIVQADGLTGNKLLNFKFNGDKIAQSVQKGVEAVLSVANKFQIGHVGSVEEAAQILNTLSQNAKGAELEQINAIHQVLTGTDTEGYVKAQAPKPSKGKSNGKQLSVQATPGVGAVSEQGGASQVNGSLTGLLQPGAVQPVGAGNDVGAAVSQQAGQLSGEGIRTGPSVAADNAGAVNAPQVNLTAPAPETNQLLRQVFGGETASGELVTPTPIGGPIRVARPQATGASNETGTTQGAVGRGQAPGQPRQTSQPGVGGQSVQNGGATGTVVGARQYDSRLQYYGTDLSHISSPRRIEIIQQLLLSVLSPKRDSSTPAETRAEILRLALIEQFPMKEIAELTGINLDTVSKQLQRMGVALKDGEFQVVRPAFAEQMVAKAEAFRSSEFPDGIGIHELKGLYSTRYEGKEKPATNLAEELEAGEQEGDRSKLLAEERFGGETGEAQSMGTIGSAGGSQGAVDSDESKALSKVEKLQKQLDETPDTDVAGKANLSKQLAAAWSAYEKEQKDRAKTGETKVRYKEEKATELGETETEGEENAVQVESADEGDVREPAGGGEEVGEANAKPKKPARARKAKAESKPAEETKPEVKTPEQQWAALAEQFPQMPPYATLNKDEKIRWDDVANRGVANLAAADKILSTVVKAAPAKVIVSEKGAFVPSDEKGKDPIASAGFKVLDEDNNLSDALAGATMITGMDTAKEGQGTGSKLLKAITDWADANGKRLVLIPAASPKGERGLSQEQLKAWYTRNGFKDRVDYMVREPAGTTEAVNQINGTAEQKKTAQALADSKGGSVIWQDGDLALIRGYSVLTGQPVYAGAKAGSITKVDIESFTGSAFTPDEKAKLVEAKQQAEKQDAEKHAADPFIKFDSNGVAVSKGVSPQLAGVISGWKQMLGIKASIYVTTIEDAKADKDNFTGPQRAVGSAGLDANEAGSMRKLSDGSYYIAFTKGTSVAKMLETMAHEIGHVHEKEAFANASPEDQKAIRAEFEKWRASTKGKSAKEVVESLRARATGRSTKGFEGKTSEDMTAYWKSFSEWYADQVSRWATTSEKPLTVVEKFFARLGAALKKFYYSLKGQKYLPSDTMKSFLDKIAEGALIIDDKSAKALDNEFASQALFVGIKGVEQRGMTPKEEGRFLQAKLMDATGALRSDVWYDTGWLRGADSQWRTEISDKNAKLKAPLPNFGTGKLGDLLDHPTLYKLYPQLTGYTLVVDPKMEPNSAAFIPDQQEIHIASVQSSPVTTLLHEVQHAIQEIEGFGKGANPKEMDMFNVNAADKFAAASHVFGYVSPEAQEAIAKYRDAVEAKHLAVVTRDTGDFKTVDEERAAVQRTMNTDKAARRALGEMLTVLDSTEGKFKQQLYSMVSGEIEARDAEARHQYDDMLRRQVVPGEAEGFTPETQLVYDKASESYMKVGKTADERAREQISKLPPKWQPAARTVTTTLMHTLQKAGLASMITEDVINAATKYMKSAQNYLTAQYARQATRLAHELKIEKILQQYDKLPENLKGIGKGSVNEYIHDSTREGLWGYYPDARMVGTSMAQIDPEFKRRFNAFPPAAQKLIKAVFEQGHDSLVAKQNAVTDAINREYADRAAAVLGDADLTAELNKEKNLRIARESKLLGLDGSKPYAYMGRYGDYVVVAKSAEYKHHEAQAKEGPMVKGEYVYGSDSQRWLEENQSNPAHYVVQFAETLAEADQIAHQLNATGNYDIAESFEKEPYSQQGGEMFAAVARLRDLYERESDGDNPAAAKAIRNLLGDLYLHTVSEASARKSEFQRLNISGSDKDMMRNLATRGRADAHFLAALQHNDAISDAISNMRKERNNNRREATPYFNELLKRHANSMKYETPGVLANALQRMSTVWYLSTNPAFYLQQVLQTGTISLPYMAGRLGYFRSARAIKLAYSDLASLVKGLGVADHIDFDKAPADVRDMLKTLVGMGKIDIGIDSDSTARAGDTGVTAAVMQKLQGVNNRIETINRATAAIAAYRGYLERYKNNDKAAAIKYAAEVVSNTHGSYDAFNTPRIMSSGAGKVLLQFKRFQIIQISMLAKLLTTAFKGASAEERAVARHSLAFITGQMGVLGGMMAVPFAQQAASVLSKIFGDPEEPDDWEFKLRRMIGDKAVADLLINGVPGSLGLDVSGKIGMGNVFSILPYTNIDFASRSGAEKILVGLMGPSASLGLKFADGLGLMSQGDYYKGLEQMMPNGIANVMKAGRFAKEGITMRNGDVVLKPEEISMLDAAFQAVGLPTSTIVDRQFTQKVVKEFDQYYHQRDIEIKGDYVEASRKGDSAAMADARDEWHKLQDARVANGYKRQPYSDLYKAPMAATKRERNIAGGVEFGKSNRRFVESLSTI